MKLTRHFSSFVVMTSILLSSACGATDDPHAHHAMKKNQSRTVSVAEALDCSDTAFYMPLRQPAMLHRATTINTKLKAKTVTKCVAGNLVLLKSYIDDQAGTDDRPVGPTYVMEVTAGDVERWRFIHSGISATVNLGLQSDTGAIQPSN